MAGKRKEFRLLRNLSLILVLYGVLFLTIATANAATYHLDAINGKDTNLGTSEQPWKTLLKAQAVAVSGDTVIVRNGSYGAYSEAFVDRTNWVTYRAAAGHKPELTKIEVDDQNLIYNTYLVFDGFTVRPAAGQDTAVVVRSSKYTKFLNLNIVGQGANYVKGVSGTVYGFYGWEGSGDITIDHCTFSGGSTTGRFDGFQNGIYLTPNSGANTTITNNEIKQFSSQGILTPCNSITISSNNIHYFGADAGIFIGGGNGPMLLENNQIHDLRLYQPALTEIPTATTWSSDGKTMTNPNASWGESTKFGTWIGKVEIWIISGNNVNLTNSGDNDVRVASVSPTQIVFDKSIGNGGGTPSNVNYILIDSTHGDCIQQYSTTITSNLTIRKNKFYDCYGQFMWVECGLSGSLKGTNFLFENNLFWNTYTSGLAETGGEYGGTVGLFYTDGMIFRNNTVIGRLQISGNSNVSLRNNIVGYIQIYNNSPPTNSDYNIFNRGTINSPESAGSHDTKLFPDESWTKWNDSQFTSIFAKYTNGDFRHASANSLGVGHGDPGNFPTTDILGGIRDAHPDAGCYEYVISGSGSSGNHAPVLQNIGNKSVNENAILTFIISATDADANTITYSSQNLPNGATFVNQVFSWTPTYQQAGNYQVTFSASDGIAQDSETITITVVNVNRPPVLASIGNKSVNENNALTFSVSASDPDGDTITYSAQKLPTGATFVNQVFSWTPSYSQAGSYQATFNARDNSQAQASETITITVNNVDRAPILKTIGNKSVYVNNILTFTVSATDPDGDIITYSVQGLPSGATFTSQRFSWTPLSNQAGSYQVTFVASDGQLQDSQTITLTVYAVDTSAPIVNSFYPAKDSIQVPLNSLINFHIVDAGSGVDANSVLIKVNNNTVYSGNIADYNSAYGNCHRTGTKTDYTFIYQSGEVFNFDRTVNVTVNAADLAGNVMNTYSYPFNTEMWSFGKNKKVSSGSDKLDKGNPVTVTDSNSNIWVAWDAGSVGSRDIYIGKLAAGDDDFGACMKLTNSIADHYNPAIAVGKDDKLYVAWQDNRTGKWNIYISTSTDGIIWSAERKVTDSDSNHINPAIVIDSMYPNRTYIAWQDDLAGNQDIYIASSNDGFATKTVSRITSDNSDQTAPAIAIDSNNTLYVVWADSRNGTSDIYGTASNKDSWTNIPIVNKAGNQSSPAIAAETSGTALHFVWVDDIAGNKDIYYAESNGLPTSPLSGRNIVDDSSDADQMEPAIITSGAGVDLRIFACWQDKRNVTGASKDTDLYLIEINSSSEINVCVGDDTTNSNQSKPAIGIDGCGYPYLVWVDDRNTNTDIYYAGSTVATPNVVASKDVSISSGATVGTEPADIKSADDVSVVIPPGAYPCDINVTIAKVKNPSKLSVAYLSLLYDFGPSGTHFVKPVTVTIPFESSTANNLTSVYWYNPLTGSQTQQGISNIKIIKISPTLRALRFKTTHFTQFFVGGSSTSGSSGGGGGCSMSRNGQGSVMDFMLPYVGLTIVMVILKLRNKWKRKSLSI